MYKSYITDRMLAAVVCSVATLIQLTSCGDQEVSGVHPKMMSISDAAAVRMQDTESIHILTSGRLERLENGGYVLESIPTEEKHLDSQIYLIIETDDAQIAAVLEHCTNEDVSIEAILRGGDPPILRILYIDEMSDVRKYQDGTCE